MNGDQPPELKDDGVEINLPSSDEIKVAVKY
jgi:hypothetical protein